VPAGGVEGPTELLDGLRHRLDVGRDDDRASLLDDPLGYRRGVGVRESTAREPCRRGDDGGGRGRSRVDPDDDAVSPLDERVVLDAVAALSFDLDAYVAGPGGGDRDVFGTGLDGEDGVREAAVLLGHRSLVREVRLV